MEDTTKLYRKIEKVLSSNQEDPDALKRYMDRLVAVDMNLTILTKTGIGMIINKVRKKCQDPIISELAKQLIRQWKKLVPKNELVANKRKREDAASSKGSENASSEDERQAKLQKRQIEMNSDDSHHFPSMRKLMHKPTLIKNQETSDPFRIKARDMIVKAINREEVPEGSYDVDYLSIQIETNIYNMFLNTDKDYKQQVRTRVMNLRDEKNPELRLNVLNGSFSAEKLASCDSKEMASKEMQELRATYMNEIIKDSQIYVGEPIECGMLKCGRCKNNKVSFNQVQTRSADEPMTTFAYCHDCGLRWKF